ncbi:MAG: hypothetical protein IKW88_10800 [Clostridiales bacterium]|nr:hypothetical protein [Clostridiales bacterium]
MTTDNKAETLVVNCKLLAIKDAKIEHVSPKIPENKRIEIVLIYIK